MDPEKSEQYEFLDLSDIEENERRRIKHTLFSEVATKFLQLPWSTHVSQEEWQSESFGEENQQQQQHVPNGPSDQINNSANAMVVQDRSAPTIAQHVPIVTMYSQPPTYSVPPPSTGYQHPPNMIVSNMSPNMHGYVPSPYVQPVQQHYNMPESADMVRGHRGGRNRGRGNKRSEIRMEAPPMAETTNAPGYPPQFMPIHYHPAYYTTPVGSPMQHPNAQHATGSPLYITPMYTPVYGTYPGPQYYTPPNTHMMEDAGSREMNEMPPQPSQPVYHQQTSEEEYENQNVVNTTVIMNSNMVDSNNYPNKISNNAVQPLDERVVDIQVQPAPVPQNVIVEDNTAMETIETFNSSNNTSVSVTNIQTPVELATDYKVQQPSVDTNSVIVPALVPVFPVNNTAPDPRPIVNNQEEKEHVPETSTIKTESSPVPQSNSGKTWASLFEKASIDSGSEKLAQNDENKNGTKPSPQFEKCNKMDDKCAQNNVTNIDKSVYANDPNSYRIGEFLVKYALNNRTVSLQPRGLTNRSNYCYINSILQALLACPPFYNLLKALPHQPRKNPASTSPTPIIDTMYEFVNEFIPVPAGSRINRKEKVQRKDDSIDVICGTSFEPSRIYKILNGIRSDTFIVEGRQEDAEEFFGCLLNGLNDEMLELMKLVENGQSHPNLSNGDITTNGDTHEDKDEWKVMGPKNRGSITRRADFGRTPISDIFRGQLRSRVHRTGDQVTDNVQPFFTLQLDIEKATSVCEALELLVNKDKLEGVTSSRTNQQVEAWQQVTLEELPLVMVLHLKCFNYKLDACSKIIKTVEFPIDLKIDAKLLSTKAKHVGKQKQYKLFAVVYHDGKEATKGHYLTDAYHVGYGGWVRYDDAAVKSVQEANVLHPSATRVPYLLFYRRADTIGNQQQSTPPKKDSVPWP